ncbi:MAG: hypothetical protein FWB75_07775 [Oscillospiraceae bacterium]|nr:hypothetical protein [Oscillospiraceae bacterium]
MLQRITKLTHRIEYWAANKSLIYHIASQYYKDVIKKEIDLANITKSDRILCIGGGFCPFSAILLHQATGAKVTVIDNDSACIPKARAVVRRLGLSEHIHLECKEGCCASLSMSEFTVVHFALQITPIEQVFAEVEKRVNPGTKLLIRRPKDQLSNMYCKLSQTLLACCRNIQHAKARSIGSTYLYIKEHAA